MKDKELNTFCPVNQQAWRAWLAEHHDTEKSVWLIYHKKKSATPTITWSEAVDEALCFGWIDSLAKPMDDERYMQFFCRRKANSVWSKINKDKIQRLTEEGLMTQAGINSVEIARKNGSWTILDDAEALIIPADMEEEFLKRPDVKAYFLNLSRSGKKNILQLLALTKRPETRLKRIAEIMALADQNMQQRESKG
jgi:uncharacterized protein YdeI (YjbR/CyaY-like superfamily)